MLLSTSDDNDSKMSVRFSASCEAPYQAVLRGSDTDYALFSLVNDELRHSGSGDGGLDDLEDQFNDGKIQFAFVRVKDPFSKLNKFVLINWVSPHVSTHSLRA